MKLPRRSSHFIRKTFFDYFIKNDHKFIRSSPVVPFCDPTLSFVNAGMNQFKNVFLGNQSPQYPRIVNSQKCIRVGGKHNDLSVVGHDTYHHTFFEMLGNWSFGDYFKETACKLAWNFLTSPPISISPNRLFVTYFQGDEQLGLLPDWEMREIWLSIGVDKNRVLPFGSKDNFWEAGMTGPCGSCTEIHYDYSNSFINKSVNLVNKGLQDVVELWNLVFIEYTRLEDGTLKPLPVRHVDTGLGFERFVAILQDKSSNYDTDLFTGIFDDISKSTGAPPYSGKFGSSVESRLDTAYRIIADHVRMCTVALADNMFPDQNHKLRRVLRKALVVAENDFNAKSDYKLLQEITNRVSDILSPTYPEISKNIKKIHYIIENESELIKELKRSTLKEWRKIAKNDNRVSNVFTGIEAVGLPAAYYELVPGVSSTNDCKFVDPDLAIRLYDTYGLDSDLIEQLALAMGYNFSKENFMAKLTAFKQERVKKISMSAMKLDFDLDHHINTLIKLKMPVTDDRYKYDYKRDIGLNDVAGYVFPDVQTNLQSVIFFENTNAVGGLCVEGNVNLQNCGKVALIFSETNFYSDAGGQSSDTGQVSFIDETDNSVKGIFAVERVLKYRGYVLHIGKMKTVNGSDKSSVESNNASVSDDVFVFRIGHSGVKTILKVDNDKRLSNMRNHTATHIINGVLHNLLTVTCQKSSNVNSDHLVFDFGIYKDEFQVEDYIKLENIVNKLIRSKLAVRRSTVTRDKLLSLDNVTLLPGEIYPDENTVLVEIFDEGTDFISREPCCGTHLANTGDIDEFRLIAVRSKSRNVKSLKAVTGVNAKITIKNDELISDKIVHYQNKVNDISNRSDTKTNEKLLDDFSTELQNLRKEIITSVDKKYFSYAVYHNALETIDKSIKDVRNIARELLKKKLQSEMQQVLKDLNIGEANAGDQKSKCLVHFVKSTSNLDDTSLNKVTKMCPSDIPIMLFSYSENSSLLKGRCSIPKHLTSDLAADEWMTSVSKAINSRESIIHGQDPKRVCGMKPKRIRKEDLQNTVDTLVATAKAALNSTLK